MTSPYLPPASAVSHVDALPVGTRLAEFEILSLLGVGGFGMVYQAFDHSLHRAVAIKEYMPSALAGRVQGQSLWVRSPNDLPVFTAGLRSFVGEARLLAQFDHPSLVKVFRFWEAHNTAYMVMPLYSGMTLKQARAQMRTPPSEAWLRQVLWSVLAALRTLHEGHTLHRDISPDNIFLQDIGPPVLLDLGAARHAIQDSERNHTAILKVHYAPIEQYAGGNPDLPQGAWSDLYSLAAVIYGCLCNDSPQPSTLRAVRDTMTPVGTVAKTIAQQFGVMYSGSFVAALGQALALHPRQRPQNIDAFLQAMQMTSPPVALDHFDFRAELGDIWVEPADQLNPGLVMPTVDLHPTVVVPRPSEPLSITKPQTQPPPKSQPKSPPQPSSLNKNNNNNINKNINNNNNINNIKNNENKNARWIWGMGVPLLVIAVAAAGYGWSQRKPARPPYDDIITEMAERPAPVASQPMAASSAATTTPPVAAPMAPSSAASAAVAAPEPTGPPPAFVVTSSGAQDAASAAQATGWRQGAIRRNVRTTLSSEPTPPVSPPPSPVETRPPEPAPIPAPPPLPLCFNTTVLTRSACLYRECAKPANAAFPVCIEHHHRLEQEAQRQMNR